MVDAAHLKGDFKGTMLLAVAMDGNNQILPVAYAICKSECTETWSWFMEKLHDCVGDMGSLSFISDRHAAIAAAIENIFPTSHHGICGHHLYSNVVTKFGSKKTIKSFFWGACKAYTIEEFNDWMQRINNYNPELYAYLDRACPEKWARSRFEGMRYNMMTSNSAESINALSRYARKMPVLMLIDFFRTTMQQWYFERRNRASKTYIVHDTLITLSYLLCIENFDPVT